MFSNRECFWGRYQIPIDYFNKKHCWPPTYIRCDCSELARHKTYKKNGYFYDTYVWECSKCQKKYSLIRGTVYFKAIHEEGK